MRYQTTLKVFDTKAFDCFKPEEDFKKRFKLEIKKKDGYIEIIVNADDIVSLKAISTSIIKLLEVYEKLREIQ